MSNNRVCELFGIKYPVIQAGMVWCSGWRLASAVSNAGGLGLIGAGSMYPEVLRTHIQKCRAATSNPFGVNVPLMYPDIESIMNIIVEEDVKIVFTSAGNPKTWTEFLHNHGIKVAHVVSSSKFALKAQQAGVDAIVAEGFEAGGHNGAEETTTLTLIPLVRDQITVPLIAAGGIGGGRAMLATFALGAEGVQVGSRFAVATESSAHELFKTRCLNLPEGDTIVTLKKLSATRMIKNKFFEQVRQAEDQCASVDELRALLGRGRSKLGIFEGDLDNGELEIGQVASSFREIESAAVILNSIIDEYNQAYKGLSLHF